MNIKKELLKIREYVKQIKKHERTREKNEK